MRWWVSPPFGTAGLGWLSTLVGPVVASECRGHVLRQPVTYGARCCMKMLASRRGHVTLLVFERDALRAGGGCGGGRGHVRACGESMGGRTMHEGGGSVLGTGRLVVRCWGERWV